MATEAPFPRTSSAASATGAVADIFYRSRMGEPHAADARLPLGERSPRGG